MILVREVHIPCAGCGRDYVMVVRDRKGRAIDESVWVRDRKGRAIDESVWLSYREGLISAGDLAAFVKGAS